MKNNNTNIQPIAAVEIEQAVLGAMLVESGAEILAMSILSVDSFFDERHKIIYQAICNLSMANKAIDIFTVIEEIQKSGKLEEVGGAYYVTYLTECVGSAAHIEYHARIIQQKYIQRELLKTALELSAKASDPTQDVDDILLFAEKSIYDLSNNIVRNEITDFNSVLASCTKQLDALSDLADGSISGIPSGFYDLDKITGGWQKSDLIIIAARPAMGKTAFILSMAKTMTQVLQFPVLIFSLEMSKVQLGNRIISMQTQISGKRLRSKLSDIEWSQYDSQIPYIQNLPLFIDDTPGISLFELRTKAIKAKQQYGIRCLMIDYLQLMTTGNKDFRGNREQEISTISRALKQLAKELDVPVIVLSQLSRATVQSGDPTPKLHHLRESGAIEQDADIVCFIHRPEYYGITETESGEGTEGLAEIIIAKQRNGECTTVNLQFIAQYTQFANWEESWEESL